MNPTEKFYRQLEKSDKVIRIIYGSCYETKGVFCMYNKLNADAKRELFKANTAEEVKGVLDRHGFTLGDEEPHRILKDIQRERISRAELSAEELEAAQGGRDYLHEGCAATVEKGSLCLVNDACNATWVAYTNKVTGYKCTFCDVYVAEINSNLFECPKCHMLFTDRKGTFKKLPGWRTPRSN
jgi:hypothetical protein